MRPFSHLIHFQPKIKDKLASLTAASSLAGHVYSPDDHDEVEHLRCYISFIEEHILPPVRQFDDASHSNPRRIRHDDLWYLFKPGELIYVTPKALGLDLSKYNMSQKICRLSVFRRHRGDLELPMRGGETKWSHSQVLIFFIDHDGSAYKPVSMTIRMEYFDGEKDIRSLEVYLPHTI